MGEVSAFSAEREAEIQRAVELYRRSVGYALNDPESSLNKARQFAESVGRHLYTAANLERQARPIEKLDLNELLTKLESGAVVPKHISTHFRVIQTYGNFGTHDQGSASQRITTEYIGPCIHALGQVARWYLGEHHRRHDLADRFVGSAAVARPSTEETGMDGWRELYWWAHRRDEPKMLDLKTLEAFEARQKPSELAIQEARRDFRRDANSLSISISDALEDGLLEPVEADALEQIRLACCISAREAEQFARARRPANLDCRATQPDWLIRAFLDPQGAPFRSSPGLAAPTQGVSQGATAGSASEDAGEPSSSPTPPLQATAPTNPVATLAEPSATVRGGALQRFLGLLPSERADTLARLLSRFIQTAEATTATEEKLRAGMVACQIPAKELVVVMFDLTLMGSGADACIVTAEAIYVHNPWYSPHAGRHRTAWSELVSSRIRIAESEVVVDRGADSMFVWSWSEHKNIKRALVAIQQHLLA